MPRLPESLPQYNEADAPRLALEIVRALDKRVRHAALDELNISNEELQAAIDLDGELPGVEADSLPNVSNLVLAKMRFANAEAGDPFRAVSRERRLNNLVDDVEQEKEAAEAAKWRRRWAPRAGVGAGAVFLGAMAVNAVHPEIMRLLAQNELNEVAVDAATARILATNTPSGVNLKGVPIRFACIKEGNEADGFHWQPGSITDVYSHSSLKKPPFNVDFKVGVDPDISIANAGLGTTVQFLPEQLAANFPAAYGADIVAPGGSVSHIIPTGQFVADPENVVSAEFTTGEHAVDGSLMQYVLVGPDGPACNGKAESGDLPDKMVDAILDTEFPEVNLEDLNGAPIEVDGAYTAAFEKYELDEWYSREFHPNLVKSVDQAIREGSKGGVAPSKLKVMSDFLADREFEKSLLKLLQFLEENVEKDTFEQFLEQIRGSNAPHITVNVQFSRGGDGTHGVEYRDDEARQGVIQLLPTDITKGVLFDGLIREISSASPVPGMLDSLTGDTLDERPSDWVFTLGIGYFLSSKGDGIPNDFPSTQLVEHLVEKGKLDDLIRFWTFNPNDKLSDDEAEFFTGLDLNLPAKGRQEDIYDLILSVSGLTKLDEATTAKKDAFKAFVETHQRTTGSGKAGESGLSAEAGAREMLTQLKELTK